jgi:hypothetical protein
MKRIMDRKVYDTEAAQSLHTYEPIADGGDFHYFIETLYATPKGSYFVAGEGGGMSPYAESLGGGSTGGGSGIRPMSLEEAMDWLEETGGHEVLTTDERFSAHVEQA